MDGVFDGREPVRTANASVYLVLIGLGAQGSCVCLHSSDMQASTVMPGLTAGSLQHSRADGTSSRRLRFKRQSPRRVGQAARASSGGDPQEPPVGSRRFILKNTFHLLAAAGLVSVTGEQVFTRCRGLPAAAADSACRH